MRRCDVRIDPVGVGCGSQAISTLHQAKMWPEKTLNISGTRGRTRTDKMLPSGDFESPASTDSATRARSFHVSPGARSVNREIARPRHQIHGVGARRTGDWWKRRACRFLAPTVVPRPGYPVRRTRALRSTPARSAFPPPIAVSARVARLQAARFQVARPLPARPAPA